MNEDRTPRPGRRALLAMLAAGVPLAACRPGADPAANRPPVPSPAAAGRRTGTGATGPAAPSGAPTVGTPTAGPTAPAASPSAPVVTPTAQLTTVTTPSAAQARTAGFTIAVCGDILLHSGVWKQAARDAARTGARFDFAPVLAGMAPVVGGADLAIAHLETPVSHPTGPFSGYPSFDVPPQILPALKGLGFAGVTTASNHSLDAGFAGLTRTISAVHAAGLGHAGTAATAADAERTTVFRLGTVKVALLSYAYGFNGYRRPAGREWAANLIDVPAMLLAARRARTGGADVVLVAVHAGEQYVQQPNAEQRHVFDALTASPDVDFVYGHHAHVVQPVTRVNGKLVVFGLGNAVADQRLPHTRDGLTALVHVVPAGGGRFRVDRVTPVPTWMSPAAPMRWLDARPAATATGGSATGGPATTAGRRTAARWVASAVAAPLRG